MAQTETLMAPDDAAAELRREQDRLAKLWQAYKLQEDELEALRRERPALKQTLDDQERTIAGLRRQQNLLQESAAYKDRHEEADRRNRILLIEVENLNRELRAAQKDLAAHESELNALRSMGVTQETAVQLQQDLQKEQERLAKLFKVYEEQEQELKNAQARLEKWESWFSRMEPAIVALPKFFADAPRA
jgi:chromosome segregation ATPase